MGRETISILVHPAWSPNAKTFYQKYFDKINQSDFSIILLPIHSLSFKNRVLDTYWDSIAKFLYSGNDSGFGLKEFMSPLFLQKFFVSRLFKFYYRGLRRRLPVKKIKNKSTSKAKTNIKSFHKVMKKNLYGKTINTTKKYLIDLSNYYPFFKNEVYLHPDSKFVIDKFREEYKGNKRVVLLDANNLNYAEAFAVSFVEELLSKYPESRLNFHIYGEYRNQCVQYIYLGVKEKFPQEDILILDELCTYNIREDAPQEFYDPSVKYLGAM